jgi:hypothetical protein
MYDGQDAKGEREHAPEEDPCPVQQAKNSARQHYLHEATGYPTRRFSSDKMASFLGCGLACDKKQ